MRNKALPMESFLTNLSAPRHSRAKSGVEERVRIDWGKHCAVYRHRGSMYRRAVGKRRCRAGCPPADERARDSGAMGRLDGSGSAVPCLEHDTHTKETMPACGNTQHGARADSGYCCPSCTSSFGKLTSSPRGIGPFLIQLRMRYTAPRSGKFNHIETLGESAEIKIPAFFSAHAHKLTVKKLKEVPGSGWPPGY